MDSVTKEVLRELGQLNRKSVFDEKAILEPDEANVRLVKVTLTPQEGLFAGAAVSFEFEFTEEYPTCAPMVRALEQVYHSNISDDGSVCFNMLSEPQEGYRIEHYVNGLLWLLDNQNFSSQLNGYVTTDRKQFKVNHPLALRGYEISGITWSKLLQEEPSRASNRRLLNEVFAACEVPKMTEMDVDALEAHFPERGQAKFLRDQVRAVQLAHDKGLKDIKFLFTASNCTHVTVRAKNASMSPSAVVKEMVLLIDDKPSLLLTHGSEGIDLEKLSADLNLKVELPKAGDLKRSGVANVYEVNLFDWTGPLFVDEKLADQATLLVSTGYPRLLAKAPGATLLGLVRDEAKAVRIAVPRVAAPTSAEPAVVVVVADPTESAPAVPVVAAVEGAASPAPEVAAVEVEVAAVEVATEVPAPSENDKDMAKREGSLSSDVKKEKKLATDVLVACRVPSDDATVKVALQSN